jgi:translocator protein
MLYLTFPIFLACVLAAGYTGARFRPGAWYAALEKPSWTPPNWVFAPVWATLYLMIALAGWLVWNAGDASVSLMLWVMVLLLSAAWSWLFFGRRLMGMALANVIASWLTIGAFILVSWPQSHAASLLFVPLLAWVSIATALNFTIWRLNAGPRSVTPSRSGTGRSGP